jgi:hypothetical protein
MTALSTRTADRVLRSGSLTLLLLLAGCSSHGSISGKITYKGKPLSSGTVTFVPEQGGGFSCDIHNGEYKIANIPSGPAKIAVIPASTSAPIDYVMKMRPPKELLEKAAPGKSIETPTKEGSPKIETPFPPDKFKNPDTSGLTYTVKSGPQVHDIDLADK